MKKENIAPADPVYTVTRSKDEYRLTITKWGMKFPNKAPLIFNSRIETIKEKSYWKKLFTTSRCIIPMTAFYEWIKEGDKKKPQRIYLPEDDLFFVPGIFTPVGNDTCTSLITTSPNKFMVHVHNRMPVLLSFDEGLEYLHNDFDANLDLCQPYPDIMKMGIEPANI